MPKVYVLTHKVQLHRYAYIQVVSLCVRIIVTNVLCVPCMLVNNSLPHCSLQQLCSCQGFSTWHHISNYYWNSAVISVVEFEEAGLVLSTLLITTYAPIARGWNEVSCLFQGAGLLKTVFVHEGRTFSNTGIER